MQSRDIYQKILANICTVIKGQSPAIRLILASLVSGGHVLLEDVPGTGKTTLAKALAKSIDASFNRVQFTPDLLPTDITGVSIYDPGERNFRFHEGPVFTNILLADEINRASPRTQSALLEAMAESQVSVDGVNHPLEQMFFVIATQNPIEFHGTYPLPEAQMDRFAMRLKLGYVDAEHELEILADQNRDHPLSSVLPCVDLHTVVTLRERLGDIRISDELRNYIVNLIRATREAAGVLNGASPRASLALMKASQALAMFDGLEFVTPDLVQELAVPVIAHRLMLDSQAQFSGSTASGIVEDIVKEVPAPA